MAGSIIAGATGLAHVASQVARDARPLADAAVELHGATAPVLVVGAGPTGMATAIGLARKGIHSVVFEKYGEVATRGQLLNLNAAALDNVAAIGADSTLARIRTVERTTIADEVAGEIVQKGRGKVPLEPDPTRSVGDVDAVIDAYHGVDHRPTGRIEIGEFENSMRAMARNETFELDGVSRRYSDFIDLRFNTAVRSAQQGAEGVRVQVDGQADAIEGSFLVHSCGGRAIDGIELQPLHKGNVAWFIGGEFPGSRKVTTRITRALGADGLPYQTIGMTTPSKSIVWAQVPAGVTHASPEEQRAIVRRRALGVLIRGDLVGNRRVMPVRMQVGETERAVDGRVLGAGDTNRAPYFPTSTGAAMGISVDAPLVVDALDHVINGGVDHATAFAGYERAVLEANAKLTTVAMAQMGKDLSVPQHVIEHPEELALWLARRDEAAFTIHQTQHHLAHGVDELASMTETTVRAPELPAAEDIATAPVAPARPVRPLPVSSRALRADGRGRRYASVDITLPGLREAGRPPARDLQHG